MLYKAIEEVKIVGEGNRTESDHMLIEVELTGMERKRGKKSDIRIKEKSVNGRSDAISRNEGLQCSQEENGRMWKELKEIDNSITKIKKKIIS